MKMTDKEELQLLMLEKERRRRISAKEAESNWENLKSRTIEGAKELAIDIPRMGLHGASYGFSDEILGGAVSAYKKATGDSRPFEEVYNEARDFFRGGIEKSRERSPVVSFISEMAGGMATGGGSSKLIKSAGQGALYGAGEAQEIEDIPSQSLIGAGIGGAVHGATRLAEIPFSNTSETRAKYLGATKKDFEKSGLLGDPIEMAKDLEKRGFFKSKKSRLNVETGKFEPVDESTVDKMISFPDRNDSLSNAQSALNTIKNEKTKILNKTEKKIDLDSLINNADEKISQMRKLTNDKEFFDKTAEEEMSKLIDDLYFDGKLSEYNAIEKELKEISKRPYPIDVLMSELEEYSAKIRRRGRTPKAHEIKKEIKLENDIEKEADIISNKIPKLKRALEEIKEKASGKDTINRLEKSKQAWQNKSAKSFEAAASNPVFSESGEVQKKISTAIKETIEDHVASSLGRDEAARFIDLNKTASSLHQAKKGLKSEIAQQQASGYRSSDVPVFGSIPYQLSKAGEFIGGGETGQLVRARIGDKMKNVPDEVLRQLEFAPTRAGVQMMTPDNGREPQSISTELVKLKIPRTTQDIMNNREAIELKVAQQMPQMFDQVRDVFENNPEAIPDLALVLSQAMPALFEADKYGRIDGVIYDPAKKEMARGDIRNNDSLSNSEKMLLMNKLNKTGEYPL